MCKCEKTKRLMQYTAVLIRLKTTSWEHQNLSDIFLSYCPCWGVTIISTLVWHSDSNGNAATDVMTCGLKSYGSLKWNSSNSLNAYPSTCSSQILQKKIMASNSGQKHLPHVVAICHLLQQWAYWPIYSLYQQTPVWQVKQHTILVLLNKQWITWK